MTRTVSITILHSKDDVDQETQPAANKKEGDELNGEVILKLGHHDTSSEA